MPVAARRGGSADRSGRRWPAPFRAGPAVAAGLGGAGRRAGGGRTSRILDLGVHRADVEVDLGIGCRAGVPGCEVGGDALRDPAVASAPAAQRCVGHGQASASGGRTRRQPVFVRRMPSASGGPSTSPARRQTGRVGRPELERVEAVGGLVRALARPLLDRVGGRVEQLVEALLLLGREASQDVVDGVAVRLADADPEPTELLGPELVDDRTQAVVPARAAALAEAELAERQREVVLHDQQIGQRRVLTCKDLAHREAGVVHVGERLDEREVESAEPAHDDVGRIALAALARPPGALRDPVHDQPADVVAGARVLRTRVPETHDDLQRTLRRQHDRARSRRGRARIDGSSDRRRRSDRATRRCSAGFVLAPNGERSAGRRGPGRCPPRRRRPHHMAGSRRGSRRGR